jgi:hypothetical protein
VGTRDDLDADVDALDRRSTQNLVRSTDLVREVERDLHQRREHLATVDDSLRKVRAITDAVEVRGGRLLAGAHEVASADPR